MPGPAESGAAIGRLPRRLRPPGPPALWLLLGVALLLRCAALVATRDYAPFGDAADYDLHATFLSSLGTYPPTTFAAPGTAAALRPPGYPYWLGGIYDLTGMRFTAGRGVGVLLGVLSVGLVRGIAARLWDARVAAWSAGVAAVLPALVWLPAALLAETLFVPLVLGAVLCLLVHRDRPAWWWVAGAGALIGAATLTRSNGLILLLPVLAGAYVGRRRVPDAGVALLCAVVVLVPWTVRNAGALGAFSPLGTQSGFTLAGAYNDEAAEDGPFFAAWRVPTQVPAYADLIGRPGHDEADVDAALRGRALDYARDHPGFVARSFGVHLAQQLEVGPHQAAVDRTALQEQGIPAGQRTVLRVGLWLLVALAAAGSVVLLRRRGPRTVPWWLVAVPVLLLLAVVPLLGSPRYRVPVDPFLALPAGVALATLAGAVRSRAGGNRPAGVGGSRATGTPADPDGPAGVGGAPATGA